MRTLVFLLLVMLTVHCCLAKRGNGPCKGNKRKICKQISEIRKQIQELQDKPQEVEIPCSPNPCQNDGICKARCGKAECTCKPGFAQPLCEPLKFDLDSVILKDHADYSELLKTFMQDDEPKQAKWERCYRASENGYSAAAFHKNCDNKGPTITLVQVGNYVFGGYVSRDWTSDNDNTFSDRAFLFSLNNHLGIPFKTHYDFGARFKTQMFRHADFGPTFGGPGGGTHDLHISDKCNENEDSNSQIRYNFAPINPTVYANTAAYSTVMAGTHKFKCSEYEVFYRAEFS